MERTELEENGAYKRWITNFDEEDTYYKIRMYMKKYLRDLKELVEVY